MIPFDPEVPVIIGCPDHGDFYITPNDHTGKNPERIAYGCQTATQTWICQP